MVKGGMTTTPQLVKGGMTTTMGAGQWRGRENVDDDDDERRATTMMMMVMAVKRGARDRRV